jgi:recombination protein RecR
MAYKENYPSKLLEEAVDAISTLPGVGRRSALRLALHLLKQPSENVHHFTSAIARLRDDVKYCRECMMISDEDVCSICSDRSRDHRTICVVESVRDVMSIENTGQYHGVYHVLGGIISPINGVGPSDLTIRQLVARVADLVSPEALFEADAPGADGAAPEVIMALSGDVEGETTAFYIYRQLSQYDVKISSLARGLGFGDDLEYADELTLGRSLVNRQPFKV